MAGALALFSLEGCDSLCLQAGRARRTSIARMASMTVQALRSHELRAHFNLVFVWREMVGEIISENAPAEPGVPYILEAACQTGKPYVVRKCGISVCAEQFVGHASYAIAKDRSSYAGAQNISSTHIYQTWLQRD